VTRLAPYVLVAAWAPGLLWCGETRRLAEICADFYAGRYGVPRELVYAVIEVESAWEPFAVSSKGAAGLMQLMPATAMRFGVRSRFRMEENVQAGVAYLAYLQRRFRGDLRLITAAYFAGENAVASRGLSYRSPEVYRYVSQVARVYRRTRVESMEGVR
jgi:soluble lytic murein transglycosylase-like protein